MVLRHSTELASKYMVDIKGFDLNPLQHIVLVWNSSTPNMRGKFDVAWKLSPKFYDICEVQFPADPCASSILATLPRLYRPLCTANWFSENPQQQKTKAAIWSLNHMEMFLNGITNLMWADTEKYDEQRRILPAIVTVFLPENTKSKSAHRKTN